MHLVWAILGIILLLWDIFKKDNRKLIFALSFLFCAIIAYKYPDKIIYQPLFFVIFSMTGAFLINTILKNESVEINKIDKLKNCEGKEAIVTKDIGKTISIDGIGFISYNNELYKAKSVDDKEIKTGQKVIILSREDMILNVEAVK